VIDIDPSLGQAALNAQIEALSADPATHGILLELPLAKSLDSESAIDCIAPLKDVDGLTVTNLGRVAAGAEDLALVSATPRACVALAETAGSLNGAAVAVVGRGRTVGRPLAAMLTNRNATVTVCHSRTPDLAAALAPADMVFTATGSPGLVNGDVLRQGQVVIDAGISVVDGGLVGDVDADSAAPLVRAMTPVPGGVGPLTSTLIFENVLRAMQLQGVVGEDLWAGQSAEADNA
ncbi:MAG: bifunctional 5,10-methylenetetrahydrofolate dehydrogenase/5,10-methenyltetrahydrofolate cyclohydrolase, partial [Pseudomonadota bacterium]